MLLLPTCTSPRILAPVPMKTLSPITGAAGILFLPPIVTLDSITQFLPITAFLWITTPTPPYARVVPPPLLFDSVNDSYSQSKSTCRIPLVKPVYVLNTERVQFYTTLSQSSAHTYFLI